MQYDKIPYKLALSEKHISTITKNFPTFDNIKFFFLTNLIFNKTMHVLIILAHGSKRKESNLEIESLVKKVALFKLKEFEVVMPAFLEFEKPSITEAIDQCAVIGATEVTLLPYFLSAGVHITKDIPTEVEKSSQQNPNLKIKIADYFGSRDEIAEILVKTALNSK